MVVQNYNVQTSSQRTALSLQSATMLASRNLGSLRSVSISAQNTFSSASQSTSQLSAPQDSLQLSNGKEKKPNNGLALGHIKQAQKGLQNDGLNLLSAKSRIKPPKAQRAATGGIGGKNMPATPDELRKRLMELMFELLSGKRSTTPPGISGNGYSGQSINFSFDMSLVSTQFNVPEGGNAARAGWSVEQFFYESETVSYQAQGVVHTADGRTLNVDINMHMSRQYVEYMNFDIEAARNLCDPLVINYGGTAASLLGETFSFDLTSDGNMESLAMLAEGSGFLALDKNGDGIINDGSELFGPNSGCGFGELREYDKDFNGWIDEADEVFDKLVVWTRDKDGNDKVYTLKELGIGAIYLGDIATEFSFKDDNNQTLGVMRSTSFFLKEDGGAGTVSHIDLAV